MAYDGDIDISEIYIEPQQTHQLAESGEQVAEGFAYN